MAAIARSNVLQPTAEVDQVLWGRLSLGPLFSVFSVPPWLERCVTQLTQLTPNTALCTAL